MKTRLLRTLVLLAAVAAAAGCQRQEPADRAAVAGHSDSLFADMMQSDPQRPDSALLHSQSPQSDLRQPDVRIRVRKGRSVLMQADGVALAAADSAIIEDGEYSITILREDELEPMPQGMVNVTGGAGAGYRLLPGGDHFKPCAELRMRYDESKLPFGYTASDVYTSYYDESAGLWVRLYRKEVDTANKEIVSLTSHFTDFVNEVLKAPEMPETQAFVPTMMSDLEAVSPMDGLTMIQPPTANNNGTANVSYPIVIPAGRGGMQPNLALNYSSSGGSSWLGVGWDIPVPAISLDTRWGVPRYNASKETEIYLLDGEQLVTKEADGTPRPMPHRTNQQTNRLPDGTQFYARTGDAHDSIIRHGTSPQNYWWEVVDRNGTTHYYGHYIDASRNALPQKLCDDSGNIARWPLCESRDLYGNGVRYYYDLATVRNHGAVGRQLYLDSISYTGHGEEDGYYTVVFCRTASRTTDIPVSCNNGFKEITDQVLDNVYVKYGDSILTAWLFDMENAYKTNYKNRLSTVTKIDSAENGMRGFLAERCHCVQADEDEDSVATYMLDPHEIYISHMVTVIKVDDNGDTTYFSFPEPDGTYDTIIIYDTIYYPFLPLNEISHGFAGSTYLFDYYDAPAPDSIFGDPVESFNISNIGLHGYLLTDKNGSYPISQATGLGLSHSSSWNVGGTASGGFGPAICLTSLSLGGNYTRSESSSESLMTLVDLDGDGLADKVYAQNGIMYFCRHKHNSDGTIEFEGSTPIFGAEHFLQESSYSNTFGGQYAVGFSGSSSWTTSKSTTSTYFADVNGDGLVDLVDNGQVLFNNLNANGHPSFHLYDASLFRTEGEEETEPYITSASECGGIIFDGGVDDSITCERIWVSDTSFRCDTTTALNYYNFYLPNPDTLVGIEPVGLESNLVEVKRYHREWDCAYHDDSPSTEAVRVWIAPMEGRIHLSSQVGLKESTCPERSAARHADGVVYSIQHTKGVTMSGQHLSATGNDILRNFNICDTCYESNPEYLFSFDSTFDVFTGDMIFFRLRSKADHQFDDVHDHIAIRYVDNDGLCLSSSELYSSDIDFLLSSDLRFQAPVDGAYEVVCEYVDSGGYTDLNIYVGGDPIRYEYTEADRVFCTGNIDKGENLCISLVPNGTYTDWNQVKCRPYIIFIPDTNQIRYDINTYVFPTSVTSSKYLDTIRGWIPYHVDVTHESGSIYNELLLRKLFGPLYKGWGQFAYHSLDTGAMADYIRVERLIPPDILVPGVTNAADTAGLDHTLHESDNLDADDMSADPSYESFQEDHGNLYNPLSYESYWVEMTPDVEHQAWVSFGRQNYIGRDSISNTLQKQWYSLTAEMEDAVSNSSGITLPSTTTYDDPVPAPAPNGTTAKAVRKVNRSETHSWSVGAAGLGTSGSEGKNIIVTDYMDMNGDRYPDNIGHDRVQYSQQWGGLGESRPLPIFFSDNNNSVTSSHGKSFSGSPISEDRVVCSSQGEAMFVLHSEGGSSISLGGNIGHDESSGSWIDINGDGLLDFVSNTGNVFLNAGYRFLNGESWGGHTVRAGISGSVSESINGMPDDFFNVWQGSIQAGAGITGAYNQTTAMLMDLNGDGLPDKIWRNPSAIQQLVGGCSSNESKVSFNLGNGQWSSTMRLDIDCFHQSTNYSESLNAGLTLGFTLFGVFKVNVGADGSPYSGSVNRDKIQLVDVDADGLPDLVSSESESQLVVRYNRGGRTNLLRKVTNLNNADFQIEYTMSEPDYNQPSRTWLMTKLTTHDPLNDNNGATATMTEFAYATPRYDRYERTSYGFETVTSTQIDPATRNAYRKTDRTYHNSNMLRRGRLKRELTYVDSNTLFVEKLYDSKYVDYTSGDTLNSDTTCPVISYPAVDATFTTYYEGGRTPLLVVGERMEYDRYHNVVRYTDLGDTSDASDGLVIDFRYFTGLANNLIGLRRDYTITPTSLTTAMRRARFEYDFAHGKMTRQVLYNGADSSVYDFVYEPTYGNLGSAMQPENINGERMTYHYTYDNVVHTYPIKIVNSHSETMNTVYDYRFGKPLTVTDPTGSTMTYRYDFAGRLVAVNSPLNTSDTPSLVNQYHPMNYYQNGLNPQGYTFSASPTGHPYTVSKHYDDNGNLVTETAVLINGFGQAIQTKKGLCVGSVDKMQVSGRAVADAFGRTIEQYDPVVESSSTHRGRYNTGYDANSLTATIYDVLDRTTNIAMPLSVTTQTAYSIGNDLSGHRRFVTTMTDPNGNITTQYADYDGRQVQVTDAGGGITRMHYDNLGQLDSVSDPEGFKTRYFYDMLGRMTKRIHPDAGETRYIYDNTGNLLEEDNPLGQINYDYTYCRVLQKRYSNMTGNDVTYTYGTSGTGTGRPVRVVDGSGMYECTYDALGNVIDETRTIALPQHSEVYRFRMLYQYDSWGRMLTMTYPDGEKITYTYRWGGNLYAMHGKKNGNSRTYINGTFYNMYGQKERIDYGNATSAFHAYDVLHRLINLKSQDQNGALLQDIDYTFDNASNVTSIVNNASVVNTLGGAYVNIYGYDVLHRLVGSYGDGELGSYNTDHTYSPSGRLIRKYRDNSSVTLSASADMDYGYCDDYQPHAVRRIFDHRNEMLYDMRWDDAGNLGQVSLARPGEMMEAERFLFWTEDNRMHAAADDRYYSYYAYDHSGERRLKLAGDNNLLDVNADFMATCTLLNEPTLYPSAYIALTNKGYTKHYYAGAERVAARLGGGGLDALHLVVGSDEEMQWKADVLFDQSLLQVNDRVLEENDQDCIMLNEFAREEFGHRIDGIPIRMKAKVKVDHSPFMGMVNSMLDDINRGQEKEVYFYHSDHLGSASWITDSIGIPIQHLQYLPYGEPYIDQRAAGTTYSERFRFTGKERDEETGYGYFGARYMDHELMTMWLSVDPMSDKYPSISPYAYCAWNPIKLIDPDGNEGIIVSGSPGNHNNKLHFLENGLDRAKQCREYNKKSGEQSTWIIYNDPENQTSKDVISRYSKEAKKLGINVMVVDNVDDITDYINNKDGNGSREKDKISRFYYVGHATPGDLDVGFAGSGENFDPGDLKASAFRSGAYVDVVGGCRTAVADRILFGAITVESSVVDQFAKILDKKSMVVGSDVRVHYNGGVMTNRQLLAENKGREVKKHGRL